MTRFAMMVACSLGFWSAGASAQMGTTPDRPGGTATALAPASPSPPSLGGRQFPSGAVEREVRGTADPAAAERDRRQLQELNELSRQLTPPGTPVPAPHVEPERRRQ
jgi:hypothetical protein